MSNHFKQESIPSLAPMFRFQWEDVQDCFVLLYPEGMVKLSGSASEIIKRCDGASSIQDILADLKQHFTVPELENDLFSFLETAHAKGWIVAK